MEHKIWEGNLYEKNITCICVENNRASEILPDMNLRKYLLDRDYVLIARLTINDVFIKKDYFEKEIK